MIGFFRSLGRVIGDVIGIILILIKWIAYLVGAVLTVVTIIAKAIIEIVKDIWAAITFIFDKIMWVIHAVSGLFGGDSAKRLGDTGSSIGRKLTGDDKRRPKARVPIGPTSSEPAAAVATAEGQAALMSQAPIDYDQMSAAMKSQPIVMSANLNVDGEKMASVVQRATRSSKARSSSYDEPDEE